MKLIQTKETLNRLQKKYGPLLNDARNDLRPDYGNTGNGGYYYGNSVDDADRDYIYQAISYLKEISNNPDEVMCFDIRHYITEQNALKALDDVVDEITGGLERMLKMYEKYNRRGLEPYPIKSTLGYFTEISEHLLEIYNSEEIREFRNPEKLKKVSAELLELKFSNYWKKYKTRCIIHLICFIPFLALAIFFVIEKEDKGIIGMGRDTILAVVGIITILFNLLFNNHDSFKNSWKLFRKSTRQKLRATQKDKFLKETKKT